MNTPASQDRSMSQDNYHPFESILRMCAAAAPEPWYPRLFVQQTGADPDRLGDLVEMLLLEKLIQKTPGKLETGAGFVLTDLGQQVVEDPTLMERLRRAEPIVRNDPGAIIRNSLRTRVRPLVTQAIVGVNVLFFLYGVYLASQAKPSLVNDYLSGLSGRRAYLQLLHNVGSVVGADVQAGEWWRLLSATFVHGGLLHIGLNMFTLWGAGAFVEQTWGRWRLLVIYLISGWGGSCLAMAYNPGMPTVGASGAICGILAAEAVWIFLYGKHLPESVARRGRSQVFTTVVIMVGISLIPRVSWTGHLGGAVAGIVAGLLLHFQRFGPPLVRWVALAALLPLPAISYYQMQDLWKKAGGAVIKRDKEEEKDDDQKQPKRGKNKGAKQKEPGEALAAGPFYRQLGEPASRAANALMSLARTLPDAAEIQRDPKKARTLVEAVAGRKEKLDELQKDLVKTRYEDKRIEEGRTKALALVLGCRQFCDQIAGYLKKPEASGWAAIEKKFEELDDLEDALRQILKKIRDI
jgi:membrane associated rhomboid family serine protease